MTVVADSSFVVAALVDDGPDGAWADALLGSSPLLAPHLMPAEVANVLRRVASSGSISADAAALAHEYLLQLPLDLFPYSPFSARIWALRETVTAYDAWYVAIAESTGARLATLDRRLASAPGPRCEFLLPPG